MSEERPSRRAEGGGTGGRRRRGGGSAASGPPEPRKTAPNGRTGRPADPPGPSVGPAAGRPAADDPGRSTPFDRDPLRGPADSPWVRFDHPHEESAGMPPRLRPPDLSALLVALETLRAMVPAEVSDQLRSLLREVLLTLRVVIDWYLERLEDGPREPPVEEIPID